MSDKPVRHLFITTSSAARQPSPAFETLEPHPGVPSARLLPPDGWFSVDGEEWHVRGARGVFLGSDRRVASFVEPSAHVEAMAPPRCAPDCTFSVGIASRSVIEESDARVEVLTGFGLARRGSA